jgi:hypothetical protein
MMKICSNGRSFFVSDIESFENELGSNWVPFAVLLTARNMDLIKYGRLSKLVKCLLSKGAKTFVCIGDYSEIIHDEIDELICQHDAEGNINNASEIVTTFHDDESVDDAVSYFVHGTEIPVTENGGLLALIGADDQKVKERLEKL